MTSATAALFRTGHRFRAGLSVNDVAAIRTARNIFIVSQILPTVAYFAFDASPRFPCSISFSVRRGLPRVLQEASWLYGWWLMANVMLSAQSAFISFFTMQMFITGFIGVCIFRLGDGSRLTALIHQYAAGLYMADHVVLCEVLAIAKGYRIVFACALVATFAAYAVKQRLSETHGLSGEVADGGKAQLAVLAARDPGAARTLFASELIFMVCEHALFLAFVCGMASGVGACGVA